MTLVCSCAAFFGCQVRRQSVHPALQICGSLFPLLTVHLIALARSCLVRLAKRQPRLTSPRIAVPRKLARSLQHAAATAATLCPADPVPHISAIRRLVSRPVSPAAASSRRGGKDSSSSQREKKNLAEQPGTDAVLSTTATAALHSSTAAIWSPATRLLLSALQACRQTVHSGRCGAPSPRRHPRAIYRSTPPSHSLAATPSPSSRSPFSPFLH